MDWRSEFSKVTVDYQRLAERERAARDLLTKKTEEYDGYIRDREDKILSLQQAFQAIGESFKEARTNLSLETQEMALLLTDHSRVISILTGQEEKIIILTTAANYFQREFQKALAQKNTAENQIARLSSIKLDLEKDVSDLRTSNAVTRRELSDKKLVLQRLRDYGIPVEKIVLLQPPPEIKATVVAYDAPTRLVLLSAGRKQQVEEGYEFTIYRGPNFIARVKAEKVLPDITACRIIFEVAKIEKGDDAATRVQ
jgi:hypothetical protein